MDEQLKQSALDFHEFPVPGKIQVSPTKPLPPNAIWRWLTRQRGGALPEIEKDPLAAYKYTARGNLVAVISNGTAVLGLATLARWPASRSWKAKAFCLKIRRHRCV